MARASWPLLLSEGELFFLEKLFIGFSKIECVRSTPQVDDLLLKINKTLKVEIGTTGHNLLVSLFGSNFSGHTVRVLTTETRLLSRVIVTSSHFGTNKVVELLENFSLDQSSILFIALLSLSSKEEMTLVTVPMVKNCLYELLTDTHLPSETKAKIMFFDKYFLGNRVETFYVPKDGGLWTTEMEKVGREVYRENSSSLFSVLYYLQSGTE